MQAEFPDSNGFSSSVDAESVTERCPNEWMPFRLIMTAFPVSAVANVAKSHFGHTNQAAGVAVRAIFTRLEEAAVGVHATR